MGSKRYGGALMGCYEICDHRESINRGTKDEVARRQIFQFGILNWNY